MNVKRWKLLIAAGCVSFLWTLGLIQSGIQGVASALHFDTPETIEMVSPAFAQESNCGFENGEWVCHNPDTYDYTTGDPEIRNSNDNLTTPATLPELPVECVNTGPGDGCSSAGQWIDAAHDNE